MHPCVLFFFLLPKREKNDNIFILIPKEHRQLNG